MAMQWELVGADWTRKAHIAKADGITYRLDGKLVNGQPTWFIKRQDGAKPWESLGNRPTLAEAKSYVEYRHQRAISLDGLLSQC